MVIKRLSCVFRLSDGVSGKLLGGSEAAFFESGSALRHEFKPGGWFVLTDLSEGRHEITVSAPGHQPEEVSVDVGGEAGNALDHVIYLALNPSRGHPAAGRAPSVCGTAAGFDTIYAFRAAGCLRVAEERSEAGASEIWMFQETGAPPLPALFLLGSGKTSELATLTGIRDGLCSVQAPLRYAHMRSETAQPLIRLRCDENGGFFLMLPEASGRTGEHELILIAEKSGKLVTAHAEYSGRGCTDIGRLKFTGGK